MISGNYNSQNNKEIIKGILSSQNYQFKDCGDYLTCQACFRGGNDIGSVVIYPNKVAIDYVTATKYPIKDFIQLITNQKTQEELDKFLQSNSMVLSEVDNSPKLKQAKVFDKSLLNYIDVNNNEYLIKRGISEATCKLFNAGFVSPQIKGKLKGRQTFPIWNTNKTELQGFVGRSLEEKCDKFKYIIFGEKKNFVYPSFLNDKYITNCKSVILVEGILDVLRCWDCGIFNVFALFGTELNLGLLNYLLRKNVEKIIISTNFEDSGIGQASAYKIHSRLKKYFDLKSIIVKFPPNKKKDFCDEKDDNEIKKWKEELILQIGEKYLNYE